ARNGWPMTAFADFTTLCVELVRTASRLGKRRLVAEFLRALPADEVARAVAFMTGRPFPGSDCRVLNVRGLPAPARDVGPATGPPLTIADVEAAFVGVAEAGGAGARRLKDQRLTALAARASEAEREVIGRIIGGAMGTGGSDGLVLEAIAEAASASGSGPAACPTAPRAVPMSPRSAAAASAARRSSSTARSSPSMRLADRCPSRS